LLAACLWACWTASFAGAEGLSKEPCEIAPRRSRRHASKNFEIHAYGSQSELQALTKALEERLAELREQWTISGGHTSWSPRCRVVVHSRRALYVAATGPGAERTNGSSLVHFDRGRVVGRQIDIDGERSAWLSETLPHELTHVVLADEFPHGRLPRWADEGAAMLADTSTKRERHRLDAQLARRRKTQLSVGQLLAVEQPMAADHMAAFYGQSLTLVEHLMQRGDRRKFLDFLHEADRAGYDASLQAHYGLANSGKLAAAFEPTPRAEGSAPQLTSFHGAAAPIAAGVGR
jgi:hypothetical protein